MKGIVRHNKQLYRKAKKNPHDLKNGYNVFDYNKLELNTKVNKSLPKNIIE